MKRAIITGGQSGLGAACAERLRADGIDVITFDISPEADYSVDVTDEELESRSQTPASEAAYAAPVRGWAKLYVDHVMQADTGADLDFLVGSSGAKVDRESH